MFESRNPAGETRPPAVADAFYPGNPRKLTRQLAQFLADTRQSDQAPPKAIVVPHAGYVYSGPIAASAYACLKPAAHRIRKVVLLGPSHRVSFRGIAATDWRFYETPLGRVAVDHQSTAPLMRDGRLSVLDQAHAHEHSLEVQVPFLQHLLREFDLIPLVVGDADPPLVGDVLESLWGGPETLIVISSDLSHYLSYDEACSRDRTTSSAIERLDYGSIGPSDACGCRPLGGLLWQARKRGLSVQTVDLRNSGDTAGERRQVVGYGAYVVN